MTARKKKTARKKPESEKKFQTRVVNYLKRRGAYVVVHTAMGYGRAGIPDLLVCFKGAFFGVEVKAQNGKVTAHQQRELEAIMDAGGWAIDLFPDKMDHFAGLLDLIEELARRNKTVAKQNFNEALEDMEDTGDIADAIDTTVPANEVDDDPA